MTRNALPLHDRSDNPTGCCPRFNPDGWDAQVLTFRDLPMLRATTRSLLHVPLNMGTVFSRVLGRADAAGAFDPDHHLILSHDTSAFGAEHLFAVTKPVEGEAMTTLSGDYLTQVFEGPYSHMGQWEKALIAAAMQRGNTPGKVWFFYTTCPKCAKVYGKNPVVGLVDLT